MPASKKSAETADREKLFERLRAAKAAVVETTARDTDIDPIHIEPAFDRMLDLVTDAVADPEQITRWRDEGARLARSGAAPARVLDGFLSLNWAMWEAAMGQSDIDRTVILDFADRLLRGVDDVVAAISEGYVRVEVELAAAHSDERRGVLEEMLTAPRATPEDRARIRRRGERHGLSPQESYRLFVIHVPELSDDGISEAIDRLESRIRVPGTHHRFKPGIRLPVVLDWRGRVLVFARGDWSGESRLHDALETVVGGDLVVVDTGAVEGCEALADAVAKADYTASVAADLGRRGWIGDPGELALETTFLLDDELVGTAVEQELGPLLADPRMGEELVETLETHLGARQNIRETARRLHLAPRTVAYRLERIETLLGRELEGDTIMRLSAALLALRVSREADRPGE